MLTYESGEYYSYARNGWRRADAPSEVKGQIGEVGEFQEMLSGGGLVDDLVLEHPGEVVGDEDGVEPGAQGGIDVGAGAVADHPSAGGFAAVLSLEGDVGVVVFLGQDFDGGEVGCEAGALELAGL